MSSDSNQAGNDSVRWEKLLNALDEKLQLGLLEHLRRAPTYHFEADTLYIEASNETDEGYLKRDTVFQQLQLLAQDAVNVAKVEITRS